MSRAAPDPSGAVPVFGKARHLNSLADILDLAALAPADLADRLAERPDLEALEAFADMAAAPQAAVFPYLPFSLQERIAEALSVEQVTPILTLLADDDRAEFLRRLDLPERQALLDNLPTELRRDTERLLAYPPESVGSRMSPRFVALSPGMTVASALAHIRQRGPRAETIHFLYVTDRQGRLVDGLTLQQVVLADPDADLASVMDGRVVALRALDDQEEAVHQMKRYDVNVLPVVDGRGVLVGIVTADDVFDVAEQETTEDIHKGASVAPLDGSYSEASAGQLVSRRVGWLAALVGVNLLSSGVIAAYEELLASTLALAFFIPLLIDTGGNSGSQAATLVVRALATGDVQLRTWFRPLLKEIAVGMLLGIILGLLGGVLGLYRGGWEVAFVVATAMCAIVIVTNLIGALLPYLLVRLRIDPAVASSPLITSIADTTGLLIYFAIASATLGAMAT